MKRSTLFSISLAIATLASPALQAQGEGPQSTPQTQQERPKRERPAPLFTPEERARLDEARAKAEVDPAVVAAEQDRRDLLQRRQELLKAAVGSDPAALKALEQRGGGRRGGGGRGGEGERGDPAVREKIRAARNSPESQALQEKLQEANKTHQAALKKAMLAADPEIGPLLEKMPQGRGGFGEGRRRGGRGQGEDGARRERRGNGERSQEAPAGMSKETTNATQAGQMTE